MPKTNAFDLWSWPFEPAKTAAALVETLYDAQAVVSARMPMIAAAMLNPLGADHLEMSRMVSEKVDAFGLSQRSLSLGQRSIQDALRANIRDFGRMAGGEILWPADWMRIAERNLELVMTMATLPGKVLAPVQTRVAGNVRRLGA